MNSRNTGIETGVPAVPLTSYPGFQRFPSFSPEGTRIAFTWDEPGKRASNIYVKLIGSSEPVRFTSGADGDFGPAWSPDGRSIAFLRARDNGHASIMVMPAIGGQERELTRITFDAGTFLGHWTWTVPPPFLAWSADSKWLLALDQMAAGGLERHAITRVSVETGEKRLFVSPPRTINGDASLALAPDGRTLAFTRSSTYSVSDIYIVRMSNDLLPSGEPERVTFDRKDIGGLSWTADGRYLVFPSTRGGRLELWQMPATPHAKPVRLTAAGDDPSDPTISRQGHRLVYAHEFGSSNIWRVSLKGKQPGDSANLIASTRGEVYPQYSPDGTRVAFQSGRSGTTEVWVSNQDGTNPVQITSFGNAWTGSPRWSPDGQRIAFDSNTAGSWDIYVVNSQGGKPTRLTSSPANDIKPSWSHDGKWIYFASNRTGTYRIWKIPSNGGEEIQLTKNSALVAFESVDGETLYFSNKGPLWRMPVSGGYEIKVFDSIHSNCYAPSKHGVYLIDERDEYLKLVDSKGHLIRKIAPIAGPIGVEMSVSPDEQWMIYAKGGPAGSELMLIENFH